MTKTGGECVQWGWEEDEEEFEERRRKEKEKEDSGGEEREDGGVDIEKVLFDSVTTRTRGESVMEGGSKVRSNEEPRRGVPRQASSQPELALPPTASSVSFSLPPTLLSLFLCISICVHL